MKEDMENKINEKLPLKAQLAQMNLGSRPSDPKSILGP